MKLTVGATYRLENRADGRRSMNVYGNSPAYLANVCLWTSSNGDICQQWVYRASGNHRYFACKGNESLVLDLYTGSSSTAHVTSFNAHAYHEVTSTCYVTTQNASDGNPDYIQIRLENYSNKYLTANQNSNGTGTGRDVNAAGNVYFYTGGLTDHSQDWKPVLLDGGGDEPSPSPDPGIEGGFGNGSITEGLPPSTQNYERACYQHPGFNRFERGQCTWHCYGRAYEVLAKTIQFSGSGGLDGGAWYSRITNGVKSSEPKANSIAVWNDGGYGHVAYVEKVDSQNIYISEANWDSFNNKVDPLDGLVKTLLRSSLNRGSFMFSGFVHLDI